MCQVTIFNSNVEMKNVKKQKVRYIQDEADTLFCCFDVNPKIQLVAVFGQLKILAIEID